MNRIIKKIVKATILLIFTFSLIYADSNIQLKIETDKIIYIDGEQVFAFITLSNSGNQEYIYSDFTLGGGSLQLLVKGSDGNPIPYQGGVANKIYIEDKLGAGDSLLTFINLSAVHPNFHHPKRPSMFAFLSRMKPDEYTVQAVYQNTTDTLVPRTDTIVSKTIRFSVYPVPPEEKDAFEYLDSVFVNVYTKKATDKTVEAFTRFISTYPNSRYLLLARAHSAISLSRAKKIKEANEAIMQLIDHYPESRYAVYVFHWFNQPIEEKKKSLIEIVNRHKNAKSRVDAFARQMIKRIESKK